MMDAAMEIDIRRRMLCEHEQAALLTGFPNLPDIPLARYTDPDLET